MAQRKGYKYIPPEYVCVKFAICSFSSVMKHHHNNYFTLFFWTSHKSEGMNKEKKIEYFTY